MASLLFASTADARPPHPELPPLNQSGFAFPSGDATDSAGDLYVADLAENTISIFGADGTPVTQFEPSANAETPSSLAVDSAGNVYVNGFGLDVVKYKPSAYPPTASTTYAPDTAINGTGTLVPNHATSVAVDPANDHVFVAEEEQVSEYLPGGSVVSHTIGVGLVAGAYYSGVDVYRKTGNVYVVDEPHNKAYVLNPSGSAILETIDGSGSPDGAFTAMSLATLAVDQSNGNVLISDVSGHGVVDEFAEDGSYVSTIAHVPPFVKEPLADIAVDNGASSPNKGNVYVTSLDGNVYAFGPLFPPIGFPLSVNKGGAGTGTVTSTPAGIACGGSCEAEFEEGGKVALAPASGSKVKAWSGCDNVSGETCTVTINAAREVTASFAGRPVVSGETALQVGETSTQLEAKINPAGEATTYQFEYLSETAYEANGDSFTGPETPIRLPAAPASLGSGFAPVAVVEQATGLAPATAYRFRAVAVNALGSAEGERNASDEEIPHSFTTHALQPGGLPDGRGYEQATPIDKNGGNAEGAVRSVKAAANGAAVSFESLGGVPKGEGSQEFPLYLASRGGGNWSTQGLLPNANAGDGANVVGWTPDFAQVFDFAAKSAVGNALLSRSSADGSLTAIVPYTGFALEYGFDGSSNDGSKVLFESDTEVGLDSNSPDPAPDKLNLYAWDRSHPGTLRLAGVLPDGTAPAGGSVAGGLGSFAYLQDNRAVSASGDSAYFTGRPSKKPVGQLYRRSNPSQEQSPTGSSGECTNPALACTLEVSASEKGNGSGPNGTDAAGTQPAEFMAASTDGSVAYFTSPEKLTDNATTGPEPLPAAIARANIGDGSGPNLSFLPARARGIAIASGHVYWANPGDGGDGEGMIGRAKLGADEAEDIESEYVVGLFNPRDVAVDTGHAYWTEARLGNEGEGTIGRAKLGADEAEDIERQFITGATNPRGIDVDASHVYWVNPTLPTEIKNVFGCVGRSDISGTPASTEQCFIDFATGDVAVDGEHIYYSRIEGSDGFMRRSDLSGTLGSAEEVTSAAPILAGAKEGPTIALDSSHLYFANPTSNVIGRVDLNGSGPTTNPIQLVPTAGHPQGLAVDSSHIFWSADQDVTANPGNDLYRFDVGAPKGERLTDLAPDKSPSDICPGGSTPCGAQVQGVLGTSDDGAYAYYAANGVPEVAVQNSPNAMGESAELGNCTGPASSANGFCNLYLWHDGTTTFIARLNAGGAQAGDMANWVTLAAVSPSFGEDFQKTSRVSADGRTLLFRSQRRLTGYDNDGKAEFYLYRVGHAGLLCVSCNPTGATPTGPATLGSIKPPVGGAAPPVPVLSRNLSRSGNRVFFESTDALVAADTNGDEGCPLVGGQHQRYPACQDVYEWEAKGTGSCLSESENGGCLSLISTGKSKDPSLFGDADESGEDVFLFTTSRLVGQDRDDLVDVYDAREGGGLASQNEPEATPCQGDGCKGQPTPAPASQPPGSAAFTGPGDPAPHRKQAKNRHHKHKKHHKKRQRGGHKRSAETTGRAGR